jgi:ketosteroid isomerase-like protein
MKKLFSILFAFIFISSLVYSQDTAELKQKIQEMNDKAAEMMVANDEAGMWANYINDVISMPSYEPMLRGIEACKQSYKKMNESGMKMTAFKSVVTDVIDAGNYVIDIGSYKISMSMPGMDMPWDDHGKYMTIWEKQDDGTLKIKVETWNTDVNPWEEMQKMQPPPPPAPEGHEGHQH